MKDLKLIVEGMTYAECGRWHDGRLWFVDLYTYAVYSCQEDGSNLRVADFVCGRAIRVKEGGEILDEVSTEDLNCYAVALGGEGGKTLFLLAIPAEFKPEIRKNDPQSRVFSVKVDVPLAK